MELLLAKLITGIMVLGYTINIYIAFRLFIIFYNSKISLIHKALCCLFCMQSASLIVERILTIIGGK